MLSLLVRSMNNLESGLGLSSKYTTPNATKNKYHTAFFSINVTLSRMAHCNHPDSAFDNVLNDFFHWQWRQCKLIAIVSAIVAVAASSLSSSSLWWWWSSSSSSPSPSSHHLIIGRPVPDHWQTVSIKCPLVIIDVSQCSSCHGVHKMNIDNGSSLPIVLTSLMLQWRSSPVERRFLLSGGPRSIKWYTFDIGSGGHVYNSKLLRL